MKDGKAKILFDTVHQSRPLAPQFPKSHPSCIFSPQMQPLQFILKYFVYFGFMYSHRWMCVLFCSHCTVSKSHSSCIFSPQMHLRLLPLPRYIFKFPPHNPPTNFLPSEFILPLRMKFAFHPLNAILIPGQSFQMY